MSTAHPLALFFAIFTAVASASSFNASAHSVVWNIGNEPLAQFGGPGFPSAGGHVSGTFTFAQGGTLVDWNLATTPFAEIPGLFSSYPGFTFTPGNSSFSGAGSADRFDLTANNSAGGGFSLFVANSVGALFNQPGTVNEVVVIESGPMTTAIGFPITLTGVLVMPEPGAYAMIGAGLGFLAFFGRRRREGRAPA